MIHEKINLAVRLSKGGKNYLAISFANGLFFLADFGGYNINKTILDYFLNSDIDSVELQVRSITSERYNDYFQLTLNIPTAVKGHSLVFVVDTLLEYKSELRTALRALNHA